MAATPLTSIHFFPFSSISYAEIRLPKPNGLEILRENVTLSSATSLSYVTAGTHSLFLSLNPHAWPQADLQRGHRVFLQRLKT